MKKFYYYFPKGSYGKDHFPGRYNNHSLTLGPDEPPEVRTQEGARKLRTDSTTVRSVANGRTQGRRMCAQMLF